MIDKEELSELIVRWKYDGVRFAYECFGVELDLWQKRAITEFTRQDKPKLRLSLQACVGPGKSALLAICGWHFLLCQGEPGHHPKGAVVSITSDNLKDNLWAEYSKWQSRSKLLLELFQWTKERIYSRAHPETWFLSARGFSKDADAEQQGRTLSGLHSKYVMAQLDESGEIPPPVGKAAEQSFSERDCAFARIMQAGNPTSLSGMLYLAAAIQPELWTVIRVTGDPDDPERSPRIDIEWARQQIRTEGRENPWVMSQILGLFPPSSLNSLFSISALELAMKKHYNESQYKHAQKRIGCDVARFGNDRTVLFPRQGLVAYRPVELRNADTNQIAARLMAGKQNFGSELEFIDGTGGYGAGVVDAMRAAGHNPIEIQFAGSPIDARYLNKRAEMWFEMSKWIKRGGAIPPDLDLKKELLAPTYYFQNGKFQLEPKDQIKKRLKFSPDKADALALTFGLPEQPASAGNILQEMANIPNSTPNHWNEFIPGYLRES